MQSTDLQVIKDIPGYKVILKAVLKSQIQLLVEQLADHTGEESIILTASVSDESLSQLGSESGKVFLEDHDDIKSQFLDFCLKHHHKREQQEKEISQQQEDPGGQILMAPNTQRYEMGPRPEFAATHVQNSTRQISPGNVHPVALTRVSPQTGSKVAYVRHEPYSVASPKKSNSKFQSQKRLSKPSSSATLPTDLDNAQTDNQNQVTIKTEPIDNDENADVSGAGSDSSSLALRDDGSESSSSTIINESSDIKFSDMLPSGGLRLDSDLSNQAGQMDTSNDSVTADPKKVKVEAITESELGLETKIVEAGQMAQPDYGMMPNIQTGMGYDPSTSGGAQGSVGDQSSQENRNPIILYNGSIMDATYYSQTCVPQASVADHQKTHRNKMAWECEFCHRRFHKEFELMNHRRIHTGNKDKSYRCKTCREKFKTRCHLTYHAKRVRHPCD